ncbi:hypothetical protein [Sphaerospermopsis sp. LEGE 08334]|jgi:hypothetical protein|uniref:hypothetical protein n=1 Tax=Sphaerospermopsis sp. LEGE 08334 TaxID=1828651 RepID=UPI00187F09BD|nr:hypothetical protein [Sphaerospermopsis sp. LEGE 08334]MBE9059318.1 hypothetical protein [Sphaerospermopsis sp. LEGE 08334]
MSKTISSNHHNLQLSPHLEVNPNLTDTNLSEPSQQVIDTVQLQVFHAISGRIRILTIDGNWNEQIEHLSQELK